MIPRKTVIALSKRVFPGADQEKIPVLFQQSAYVIDNIQGDFLPVKTLIRLLRCREILQARLLQLSIPGTDPVR